VPARDKRTVGELLPVCDAVSREMFFEVSTSQLRPRLCGHASVTTTAANHSRPVHLSERTG